MIPADLVATGAIRALKLQGRRADLLKQFLVAHLTFPAITGASVVVAFGLLLELGFTPRRATLGAMAMLFGTSFLHYSQSHQENSLMMLMTACGALGGLRWARTGAMRPLVLAMAALGFDLLVRLTTVVDFAAVGALILATSWTRSRREGVSPWPRIARLALVATAAAAAFLAIDRAYHFARFGTLTDTYVSRVGAHYRSYAPVLEKDFPYNGDFRIGFLGPLISPQKSVFLFDPLLILTAMMLAITGRRARREVWSWAVAFAGLLLACIFLYARVVFWGGDGAWGDRYVVVSVWLLALIGVPLLMEQWAGLAWPWRVAASGLIASAIAVQVASVALSAQVEVSQRRCRGEEICFVYRGPGLFVVGQRFLNIADRLTGRDLSPGTTCEQQALRANREFNLTAFRVNGEAYRAMIPSPVRLGLVAAWLLLVAAVIAQAVALVVTAAGPAPAGGLVDA
jgi:hypothetical protein